MTATFCSCASRSAPGSRSSALQNTSSSSRFPAGGSRGRPLAARAARGAADRFAVEWAFLVIALALTAILQPREAGLERDVVTSLLAFAMGMQNALVRRHGVPDLATNVMTLTATALVADSAVAGGHNEMAAPLGLVAIFLVSGTAGAALTTWLGPWAPLASAWPS